MENEIEVFGMMDEPGWLEPRKTWERHLGKVKRLPLNALEREPMIETAELVIKKHRDREAKARRE